MKEIKEHILEKLVLNKNTKIYNNQNNIKEVYDDYYKICYYIYLKADKIKMANKYHATDIKLDTIRLAILDAARELRHNMKEFSDKDINMFFGYNIPTNSYNRFKEYLEKEPNNFLEYVLDHYKYLTRNLYNVKTGYSLSSNQRRMLTIREYLQRYLGHQ